MTNADIVNLLNDAVATDRDAMNAIIKTLVPCNQAMLDHPTIVCWAPEESADGLAKVGLLGLLQGIAARDNPDERIAAVYENDVLTGFILVPASRFEPDAPAPTWVGEAEVA